MPDDPQRTLLVSKMVAEGTSDDDIRATLKAYDAQQASVPPITTQRLAAEGPSAMRGPNGPNGEAPRMVAAHPYATAALLAGGAAAPFIPAGATAVEAAYPGMLKDIAKLAAVGGGYRLGKAAGVPEPVLDLATLAAGADPLMNIRGVWKGAGARAVPPTEPSVPIPKLGTLRNFEPPPNTTPAPPLAPLRPDAPPTRMQPPPLAPLRPEPVSPSTPAPPLAPLRPEPSTPSTPAPPLGQGRSFEPAPEPAPQRVPIPRLVGARTGADWTPPASMEPQQTSSIRPTPNAFVNVDNPQPLPTDTARTYHTGVTEAPARQSMSEGHKIISQEDTNYKALKATVGPDLLTALAEIIRRGGG